MSFEWIKKIYVYFFSALGLVLLIIGGVQLINLALKSLIFTKADIYYNYPAPKIISEEGGALGPSPQELEEFQKNDLISRRQRQAANALAMILVGSPLFFYHWKLAKRSF